MSLHKNDPPSYPVGNAHSAFFLSPLPGMTTVIIDGSARWSPLLQPRLQCGRPLLLPQGISHHTHRRVIRLTHSATAALRRCTTFLCLGYVTFDSCADPKWTPLYRLCTPHVQTCPPMLRYCMLLLPCPPVSLTRADVLCGDVPCNAVPCRALLPHAVRCHSVHCQRPAGALAFHPPSPPSLPPSLPLSPPPSSPSLTPLPCRGRRHQGVCVRALLPRPRRRGRGAGLLHPAALLRRQVPLHRQPLAVPGRVCGHRRADSPALLPARWIPVSGRPLVPLIS